MREIVGAYHRSCAEQITKAGGVVAKYMGDGVLAYFGYPQAHEHDAERAVVAGLALADAVPKLKTAAGTPLQVRVGIATGLVVVGDLIGVGRERRNKWRRRRHAEPGGAPASAGRAERGRHRRGHAKSFSAISSSFEDLGPKNLKGIARPVRAWAVLRASSLASRFDALHTAGLTALVGREEEIELLLRRWSRAKTGQGEVVLFSGEPGIGKSRLTAALLERLGGDTWRCFAQ